MNIFRRLRSKPQRDAVPVPVSEVPYDVYTSSMINRRHGYPLWKPGPPQWINGVKLDHVAIGHVGYIEEGRFKIICDACDTNPAIAAERQNAVAEANRPAGIEAWGFKKSGGVKAEAGVTIPSVPNAPSASANVHLQTTEQRGAALKTYDETHVLNALRPDTFKESMRKNLRLWVQLGQEDYHAVGYDNLVIVTGVDLTRSCDMLAYAHRSGETDISFELDVSSFGNASIGIWRNYDQPQDVWASSGMVGSLSTINKLALTTGTDTSLITSGTGTTSPPMPRQCTYLRGWRSRSRKAPERIKGGAGQQDLGRPPSPSTSSTIMVDEDIATEQEIDIVPLAETPLCEDPLQPLFDYIFQYSEAMFALVHDAQYPTLLDFKNDLSQREQLITLTQVLEHIQPQIDISEEGVASLSIALSSSAAASDELGSETPYNTTCPPHTMFESSGALSLFPRRPPTPDLSLDVLLDTIEQDQKQRYRSQEGINLLSEALASTDPSNPTYAKGVHYLQHVCQDMKLVPALHIVAAEIKGAPISVTYVSDMYKGMLDGRTVAVKCLRVFDGEAEKIRQAVARQAPIWQLLRHINIVPFIGVTYNRDISLVSEWMPGRDVVYFVRAHPDYDRPSLTYDIERGLAFMHSLDIVHGDLNATNVLVDAGGRARLTGFSLSIMLPETDDILPRLDTVRWMAPELLDPEPYLYLQSSEEGARTKTSDLYALAMTMWEVFSGDIPFAGTTNLRVFKMVFGGERPSRLPIYTERGLSDAIWSRMERWWDQRPSARPALDLEAPHLRRSDASRTVTLSSQERPVAAK